MGNRGKSKSSGDCPQLQSQNVRESLELQERENRQLGPRGEIASRLIGCLLGQSEPARTLAPSLLD